MIQVTFVECFLEEKEAILFCFNSAAEVKTSISVFASPESYFVQEEVCGGKIILLMQTARQMIIKIAFAHQNY